MVAAYVCFSCRRELQRRANRLARPQCLSKASFISLANVVPPTSDSPQQKPPSQSLDRSASVNRNTSSSLGALANAARSQNPRLEELFTSKDAPAHTGRYSRGRDPQPAASLGDDEAAVRLRNLQNLHLHRRPEKRYVPAAQDMAIPPTQVTSKQKQESPLARFGSPNKRLETQNGRLPDENMASLKSRRRGTMRPILPDAKFTPLVQLEQLLDDPTKTADEIWDVFSRLTAEEPALSLNNRTLENPSTKGILKQMLLRMTKSWNADSSKEQAPHQVAYALERLSTMRPVWYLGAIWELLFRATKSAAKGEDPESVAFIKEEVIRLWAAMFKAWGKSDLQVAHYHMSGEIDWSGLPDLDKLSFKPLRSGDHKLLEFRTFGHFQQMPMQWKQSLAAAILVTSDLLNQAFHILQASERFDADYKPFLEYLMKILSGSRIDGVLQNFTTRLAEREIDFTQLQAMLDRMKGTPLRASLAVSSESLEAFANSSADLPTEQKENLDTAISKKIGNLLEKKQIGQLLQIWDELRTASNSSTTPAPLGSIIYDNLIYAFDRLSRPDLTIEVWNHMVSSGLKPNADQWRKLLQGRGKDPEAMEKVWRHMLTAGIKPDIQSWNSRIHSLLLWAPNAEQGLHALDEMTKAWLAAVNKMWPFTKGSLLTRPAFSKIGDFPGTPRPNEYTLNTCVSGLVKRRFGKQKRVDLIPHVFKWADGLEISPNVVTYNTLIGMCVDDGNMVEAAQMMQQMGKQGIEPDATTFNIFLNHTFKPSANATPLSPEEQEEAVVSLLELIDSAGLDKDERVYSTLIDGLLKAQKNVIGANLVLNAMVERGVTIRPHVWTSFLTHYFQEADDEYGSGAPNFAAIEALWNRTQSTEAVLDTIFYDRIIEGYARFGEVDQALWYLELMAKQAKKPGWPCLTAIMQALLGQGLRDKALQIVHDVENSEGYLPHGIGIDHRKFNPDRNMFWQIVIEAGLREVEPVVVRERDVTEGI